MEITAPPALPILPTAPRADFADWLSPMLVKELRQGVRTRVFVILFILLQVFMLLDLVLSLLVAANREDTSEGTVFFWVMVAVPVLLIIPISGLNAIGSEIKGNTLELIFLTRLTAFRIVVGKWFALFSQALLLVCAVLPYLVLRYFMGGVNLASELLLLGTMLVGSALLTALATGVSAFPARLVRPLAAVGGLITFVFGLEFFGNVVMRGRFGSSLPGISEILTVLAGSAILLWLMLDMGAARIAPPAENHSAAMRLLAAAGFLLAAVTQTALHRFAGVMFSALVVVVLVCGVAVCEQTRAIPSIYRPFARWGWPGRIVGRFFYPGWPSGVLFTLTMFAACGGLLIKQRILPAPGQPVNDTLVWFVALAGALLLPVALARSVFRRANRPVAVFMAVQLLSLVLIICVLICDSVLRTSLRDLISFVPVCVLLSGPSAGVSMSLARLLAVSATTLVSLLVLIVLGVPAFREMRRLERESLALPVPPKNPSRLTPPTAPHVPVA